MVLCDKVGYGSADGVGRNGLRNIRSSIISAHDGVFLPCNISSLLSPSDRFKQLEVLQHVTTAFSSFMGSSCSPVGTPQGKELPPEDQERRRRVGMLFRRASKKSLSQIHKNKTQDLLTPSATSPTCASPESLQPPPSHGEKRVNLGLQEKVCLCPLAEEQRACPDPQTQSLAASLIAQECTPQPRPLRGGNSVSAKTSSQRKKSVSQDRESVETEEAS